MRSFFSRDPSLSLLILLLLLSLVLLLATSGVSVRMPKAAGQSVFVVLQASVAATTRFVRDTFNSIDELRKTQEELAILRERLQTAERLSRDIVRLRRENTQLRELLDLSQTVQFANIPAEVIAKQPGNMATQLVLNKGDRDGVRRHMPVVAEQGGVTGLVGKVVSVAARSCTVLPITGQSSYVAVRLEDSRYDGLLGGGGDGSQSLVLRHVSKLAVSEVGYGDLVITSGLGRVFPADIQVGRVRTIRSVPHEPSLQMEIEPLIDISRVERVLILRTEP